jgi:hypothetical protein
MDPIIPTPARPGNVELFCFVIREIELCSLRYIAVQSWRVILIRALEIFSCDEILNTLLDEGNFGAETTGEL